MFRKKFMKDSDLDPNVKLEVIITLPNWEKKTITKTLNVDNMDTFEQMEDEAITTWEETGELILKQMLKKKRKKINYSIFSWTCLQT